MAYTSAQYAAQNSVLEQIRIRPAADRLAPPAGVLPVTIVTESQA